MMSRFARSALAAALVTLGLAGCGSSDSEDTGAFVGTWLFASGVRQINCPNLGMHQDMLSGTMTINKGQDSPLVIIEGSCALRLGVDSATAASLRPTGQVCPPFPAGTTNDGTAITETDTHQTGSFVVAGRTATLNESGSAQLVFGATEVCSFSITGATLTKP
jgi:hypothetical protein